MFKFYKFNIKLVKVFQHSWAEGEGGWRCSKHDCRVNISISVSQSCSSMVITKELQVVLR